MSDSLPPHGLAVARQAPLSMGFSRQEYCSGVPFPPPEDLPNPGIELMSLALGGRFFAGNPININGVPKRDRALYSMKLLLLTELTGFRARHTTVQWDKI